MLESERSLMKEDISKMAQEYGHARKGLLPILEEIQRKYQHVPDFAMQDIANKLGIHPAEVYGVVTFYHFLSQEKKGKFIIRLCQTISCNLAGKDAVATQLENELGIKFGETTSDGRFTLEYVNCMGMCDQGPAMLINDEVYTHVTPMMVHDIIEACRKHFSASSFHSKEAH